MEEKNGFYLREARFPNDFEGIINCATRAFAHDPVFLYCGSVLEISEKGLEKCDADNFRTFMTFYLKLCIDMKARFTLVCNGGVGGAIVSAAYWLPPNERVAIYQVFRLLRCGIWSFLKAWGLTGLDRLTTQLSDRSHHCFETVFQRLNIERSVDEAWYLTIAMTDPDYQGRGLMSMIVRHEWQMNPDGLYLVEATTSKSKGLYTHLGFELQGSFVLGEGVAGPDGLPASGEDATGVDVFPMIRWPSSQKGKPLLSEEY